jgi:two-component system sensor histidine kinase DesK
MSCAVRQHSVVLVWLPLLAIPLFDLADALPLALAQVAVLVTIAGACVVAVLTGRPHDQGVTPYVALAVLAAAVATASVWGDGWLVPWTLLAITTPAVLRGWPLVAAIPLVAAGSMVAARADGASSATFWIGGAGVLLAAVATASFLRLLETIEELRRTREALARAAVAEERERFSRDLHDLLGHTLSVMVVKAEAVRRLVRHDPDQAAEHAADIERVGREALHDVREAVQATRAPSLVDALDGARRALDSAAIAPEVAVAETRLPDATDQVLAWVVREATTNVLRHSGADSCRIELADERGRLRLTVSDDGVGGPPPGGRRGGLDGLRRRVEEVGGVLEVHPGPEGFRLVAEVPAAVS